jgi:heme-degrading monooxygenase HmoA
LTGTGRGVVVIVRIWRADASVEGAESYRKHLESVVLPELRRIQGFRKADLLTRDVDGGVDIEVHTQWESVDSVRAFAGCDMERAVVEPGAKAVLRTYDSVVSLFDIIEYEG